MERIQPPTKVVSDQFTTVTKYDLKKAFEQISRVKAKSEFKIMQSVSTYEHFINHKILPFTMDDVHNRDKETGLIGRWSGVDYYVTHLFK